MNKFVRRIILFLVLYMIVGLTYPLLFASVIGAPLSSIFSVGLYDIKDSATVNILFLIIQVVLWPFLLVFGLAWIDRVSFAIIVDIVILAVIGLLSVIIDKKLFKNK